MKKLLSAILALLYLGTSVGATIELHYCMGRLVEWSLRHEDNSICSNCGMEKKPELTKGCCKDEYKQIKIDKDQKLSGNFTQVYERIAEIAPVSFNDAVLSDVISLKSFAQINAPPQWCNAPLNILNSVFRI